MSLTDIHSSLSDGASLFVDTVYTHALNGYNVASTTAYGSPLGTSFRALFTAAAPFVVRVPALETVAELLEKGASLHPTVSRMLVSMALAYPLGAVMPSLPRGTIRHLWTAVTGIILVQFVLGVDWLHVALPAAIVYVVMAVLRAGNLLRGHRHAIAAFIAFGYLIFRHLARPSFSSNGIDDSALIMVLVIKLYTLSYNLYDGDGIEKTKLHLTKAIADSAAADKAAQVKNIDAETKREALEKKRKADGTVRALTEITLRSVSALPDPIAYAGYVFNFSTVFVGPAFEFSDYVNAQNRVDTAAGRVFPAIWKFIQGVIWIGLAAVLQIFFPTGRIYDLAAAGSPPLEVMRYLVLSIVFSRCQYYAVWKLAEGSAVAAGFGYRAPMSSRKVNPAVSDVEAFFGINLREISKAWVSATTDVFGLGISGLADWEGTCNVSSPPPPPLPPSLFSTTYRNFLTHSYPLLPTLRLRQTLLPLRRVFPSKMQLITGTCTRNLGSQSIFMHVLQVQRLPSVTLHSWHQPFGMGEFFFNSSKA